MIRCAGTTRRRLVVSHFMEEERLLCTVPDQRRSVSIFTKRTKPVASGLSDGAGWAGAFPGLGAIGPVDLS